jgi:glycine betaine/proline transport system permease protein
VFAAFVIFAIALSALIPTVFRQFPEALYLGVRPTVDGFQQWVVSNRLTHPAFVFFFDPISRFIDGGVRALEDVLLSAHWAIVTGVFTLAGYALGRWKLALGACLSFLAFGLLGLWTQSMQTLALMLFSVLLSLVIGIPLGILCALDDRIDRALRPVLDAMQTMPAFVYLIPVVVLFGVARVPAVIATVIYAIPPAIRLTNLGIREVNPSAIEAAKSFGSTRGQLLRTVQLPLALPSILAGVNQVIMMALGMVVIAAMVGAGGLGREVFVNLQRLQVGQAFEAGLAIVVMAILLDRLSEALARVDVSRLTFDVSHVTRHTSWIGMLVIIAVTAACVLAFQETFPTDWRIDLRGLVDNGVRWLRDNLYFITQPLSDFLTIYLLNPLRDLLRDTLPWLAVIVLISGIAWLVSGWKLALGSVIGLLLIGMLGMWPHSMDTFSQVLITTAITVALAIPIGIAASQSPMLRTLLRPLLDFLQTIPTFVFLVPVIMLFNIGRVPGLIASILYAIPVGIKLVDLGMRQVSPEALEAATAFGSTRSQSILKVQLPLAKSAIAISINQMIMLVLAMVIISGLVGGAGVGLEAVMGLARSETGRGIEAGLAIVILAIIMDRITQAWAARQN